MTSQQQLDGGEKLEVKWVEANKIFERRHSYRSLGYRPYLPGMNKRELLVCCQLRRSRMGGSLTSASGILERFEDVLEAVSVHLSDYSSVKWNDRGRKRHHAEQALHTNFCAPADPLGEG